MIYLVAACTNRKAARAKIRARDLPAGSLDARARIWARQLQKSEAATSAKDMYQGEHWAVARTAANRSDVSLLVASAGYGLVLASTGIAGYSATFGRGHPDCVVTRFGVDEARSWWNAMRDRVSCGAPRLAELGRTGPIVIAASAAYIEAMHDEVLEALESGRQVLLVTAGRLSSALEPAHVPVEGRLRLVLGGSMQAVNARAAAFLLDDPSPKSLTSDCARARLAKLADSAPPLRQLNRAPLTDDEVVDFAIDVLLRDESASWSRILRLLRQSGHACEQRRFKGLYALASSSLARTT